MPWLRLWVDVLDDPDLSDLPEATCWCWTLMLAAAKKYNRDGELPPLKTLAHWMRKPRDRVARLIIELTEAGMLESGDGVISVHGWSRWQEKKDQTNAKRQAEWRNRQKAASRTHASAPAPAGNLIPDSDTEREQREKTLRNTVTENRNGDVTENPTFTTPAHDEKTTGRTGDEHLLFLEVIQDLEAHKPTKHLAASLIMAADTPEIRGFPSWRLWVGTRVIQRADKSKTWGSFLAFCRDLPQSRRVESLVAFAGELLKLSHGSTSPESTFSQISLASLAACSHNALFAP